MRSFIFRCTSKTKPEVFRRHLFGEERGLIGIVETIQPEDYLFLYNTSTYEISGPYKPTSKGQLDIEKGAWKGGFPAQIKFKELPETKTLPFAQIQHIIKKYRNNIYPAMELDEEQTKQVLAILGKLKNLV